MSDGVGGREYMVSGSDKTGRCRRLLAALLVCGVAAGCSGSPTPPDSAPPPSAPAGVSSPGAGSAAGVTPPGGKSPVGGTSPGIGSPAGDATAAPGWLGTRVLPVGSDGFAAAGDTPPELRRRSIVTTDVLSPPADGRFHATIQAVPASVLARSSWTSACPVKATDLRYVTVGFRGFDGLAHTGELLVHKRAATGLVTVFGRLFAAGYPIEAMRVTGADELNAPPTGDGNGTDAYACRPVRGRTSWSQHSYGLAVDINPFQNPYHRGKVVLPELATSYLDRGDVRPGMIEPGGPVVRAFAAIGWKWGGDYRSLKDFMHFSATGG
ncbi:M15 family metallopeptidase [Actinoplanes oblitus]|uniref:M15 family metallopeptidase n=1 Tax=Actinoplanes oblitus TaxID=3040509 RepID=A0ABY8W815_9ACTN|nr:M15 family metallopeptidase [Actinoplanes oblitus]WIM92534.1 M15 family metallopeptidase [Actinoplanes oblitus]